MGTPEEPGSTIGLPFRQARGGRTRAPRAAERRGEHRGALWRDGPRASSRGHAPARPGLGGGES